MFDAILEKAHSLCDIAQGSLELYDGEHFRAVAVRGFSDEFAQMLRQGAPAADNPATRPLLEGDRFAHINDLAETDYSITRSAAELGAARTLLCVPLRRDGQLLGMIASARREVRPFSEKEIALVENFAAQAVIAMENARLLTETCEALEQQTATAEVLQVINSSPGDLVPVFDAMLYRAMRLCDASFGFLVTAHDKDVALVAQRNVPNRLLEYLTRQPIELDPASQLGQAIQSGRVLHVSDDSLSEAYRQRVPHAVAAVELGGVRTVLHVPLTKDSQVLGDFVIFRQEVRPFSDKQIALLRNFAAQAVIAMENARLITETREALEQQTATAEVLQVINSSPGDLAPVFDSMLEKAMRLCDAAFGVFWTYGEGCFQVPALRGVPPEFADFLRKPLGPFHEGTGLGRMLQGEDLAIHVNMAAEEAYLAANSLRRAIVDLGGAKSAVTVALRKDATLLGALTVFRQEVRPFSDAQIALLQNFAAQAVIAMENARLITETREALEQQTATAEVLQVINASPGYLAPVFEAILDKAHGLCGIALGELELYEDGKFRAVAMRGVSGPLAELLRQPFVPPPNSPLARLLAGEPIVQITDLSELASERPDDPRAQVGAQYGLRTVLFVPLRKDDALLGYITAYRREVRPFLENEIALLRNFSAQAVIAIENTRLITETREALEQQTATAEVLQVINSSPSDLTPVFGAILEKAHGLCGVTFGTLQLYDGEKLRAVATRGFPKPLEKVICEPYAPGLNSPLWGLINGGRFVQIRDLAEHDIQVQNPRSRVAVDLGIRTLLFLPLRQDNLLLGLISAARKEAKLFSEREIALLENFAVQAVIAMENARLITETREALEQQTATAEVLQVINASPGELAPVFDAMLDKATRLCEAAFGTLFTYDGECFHAVALRGVPTVFADALDAPVRPDPGASLYRIARGEPFAHFEDVADEAAFRGPAGRALVELGGARSTLAVPLRKDDAVLGAFAVYRQEVRPFSDKQIALLQNFAAQAVIAMENARLITETREALDQQTATAEVLQVINSSPGDLAPVFDAILEKAHTLCGAAQGSLLLYDHEHFRAVAMHGVPEPFADRLRHGYRGYDTPASLPLMAGARFVHIPDLAEVEHPMARAAVEHSGARTLLSVPLRKGDALFGMIVATRQEVRPFTDKQIALLQNFAAQAVIAMENARLITELRQRTRDLQESLDYQTATSDVLKVISQSGAELEPVLDMLVETAARICRADKAFVNQLRDGLYRTSASFGFSAEYNSFMIDNPIAPGRGTVTGRVALESRVIQIEDVASDPEYTLRGWEAQWRTGLGVPLFRGTTVIGVIFLARSRIEPFTEKQIELVTTFADQAVIAIENARLLGDLQGRTHDLQEALEYQTATSDVLKVISQSTFDLEPVLQTVLDTAMRLLCETAKGKSSGCEDGVYRMAVGYGMEPEYRDIEMKLAIYARARYTGGANRARRSASADRRRVG